MIKDLSMSRDFEQQFEPETIERIRALLDRVDQLGMPEGVSRYYALDLGRCLQGGALLGALHVAASLLEILVREIAIEIVEMAMTSEQSSSINLQRELEEKREITFKWLVEALSCAGFFDSKVAARQSRNQKCLLKKQDHGLALRFVEKNTDRIREEKLLCEIFGLGWKDRPVGKRDFEEIIEERSLDLIDTALGIIEKISK
jgi:hypothetical protein